MSKAERESAILFDQRSAYYLKQFQFKNPRLSHLFRPSSFLGVDERHISLLTTAQHERGCVLLRDGYGAVYPLAKNSLDGIRDPWWTNLPPIRTMAANVIPALPGCFAAGEMRKDERISLLRCVTGVVRNRMRRRRRRSMQADGQSFFIRFFM